MRKILLAVLLSLLICGYGPASAAPPERTDYEAQPFLAAIPSIPKVMLVMAKDHKMFYQAYNNLVDLDNDGAIDIGFNPGIIYFGYFDSYSCYEYKSNMFVRTGASTEDDAVVQRPSQLSAITASPRSVTGICKNSSSDGSSGDWSGNWLNYAMTSRMDAIRKVLYGGKRVKSSHTVSGKTVQMDKENETILEMSYLPPDSHVWGIEVVPDSLWSELIPFSPYYDVSKYTAFNKPLEKHNNASNTTIKNLLFFARVTPYGSNDPVLRVAYKVYYDPSSTQKTRKPRMVDWTLGETTGTGIPNDNSLYNKQLKNFYARVKVCVPGNMGEMENCQQYPSGHYKPTGLLQEYGEKGLMNFGLLTGSIHDTARRKGGVLRHHIENINTSVDGQTGQILQAGLVDTIDKLQITGWGGWGNSRYSDTTAWGNPTGEMVYEAVRYFANKDAATTDYSNFTEKSLSLPKVTDWKNKPLGDKSTDCSAPVILIISDVYGEYDSDDLPGGFGNETKTTDIKDSGSYQAPPPLRGLSASEFPAFDMRYYLDKMTTNEGYGSKDYFFAQKRGATSTRGTCEPKTLSTLSDVRGLCPSDPSLEGSYSLAAVAYYGHTHDFSPTGNNRPINFYSVAMSAAFPELVFQGPGGSKISILPVAVNQSNRETQSNAAMIGFINYFIDEWHTDSQNRPFKVVIYANFEDQLEGSDYERDGFARYEINLLTEKTDSRTEPLPVAATKPTTRRIDSGPLQNKTNIRRFKNDSSSATKIDIDVDSDVVGLAISTDASESTMGEYMLMGYTINGAADENGASIDGTYLDVLYREPPNDSLATPYTCPKAGTVSKGKTPVSPYYCGSTSTNRLYTTQTRSFQFSKTATEAMFLNNPMWLAAKYGGFKDGTGGTPGVPDPGEWEDPKSSIPTPANYFHVSNMLELSNQLGAAFQSIARTVGTGTATAASINTVLGGGISIQTQFHTEYVDPKVDTKTVKWLGNVYGLFIDKWGNMREDSNNNNTLDIVTKGKDDLEQGDKIVRIERGDGDVAVIYRYRDIKGNGELSDQEPPLGSLEEVKAVWGFSEILSAMTDGQVTDSRAYSAKISVNKNSQGRVTGVNGQRLVYTFYPDENTSEPAAGAAWTPKKLKTFNEDASKPLTPKMITANTMGVPVGFGGSDGVLYIMSYGGLPSGCNKLMVKLQKSSTLVNPVSLSASKSSGTLTVTIRIKPSDGKAATVVESINGNYFSEFEGRPLIKAMLAPGDEGKWVPNDNTATVLELPTGDAQDARTGALINYTLGKDIPGWRNRTVVTPWSQTPQTWRLGDVINSKPVIVGAPQGNFDVIYGDASYYTFKDKVGALRQVAYFGSNDGLLHAVNLGFYGSLKDGQAGYSIEDPRKGLEGITERVGHSLGVELWAFVPPAVLPHLQWLADPDYNHAYYVDLKPMIVDIKNNGNSVGSGEARWEKGEWRTVLIGGLRLGGRSIETDSGSPAKYSYSEFFALDVTDPESPPVLLWRYSHPQLGLSSSLPTVVSNTVSGQAGNEVGWYVVMGSGPTTDYTEDDGQVNTGRPTSAGNAAYDGYSSQRARIIVLDAVTGKEVKVLVADEENSFFNDSFVPLAPSRLVKNRGTYNAGWTNPTVYFGQTVSRDASGHDQGGVYRLQMSEAGARGLDGQLATGSGQALPPSQWKLARLINPGRPVTGAVNSAYDANGNLWVVFGTGRLWSWDDTRPCLSQAQSATAEALKKCYQNHDQYLVGVKEPLDGGFMTFAEVPWEDDGSDNLVDVTNTKVYADGSVRNGPAGAKDYNGVVQEIMRSVNQGYKRKLQNWAIANPDLAAEGYAFELINTQPKIDAMLNGQSFMAFTSVEPSAEVCSPGGRSYLNIVDTYTGLPGPHLSVFQGDFIQGDTIQVDNVTHDQNTGIIDAGTGYASETVIVTTGEGKLVKNASQNTVDNAAFLAKENTLTSSVISWREVLDMGFSLSEDQLGGDIPELD